MLPAFRCAGRNAAFGAVGVGRLNTALAPSIWLAQPQRSFCKARARQSDWATVTLHRMLYQYSLNVRFKDQPPPAVPNSSELGKLEERLGCGQTALLRVKSTLFLPGFFPSAVPDLFHLPCQTTVGSIPAVTSRLCLDAPHIPWCPLACLGSGFARPGVHCLVSLVLYTKKLLLYTSVTCTAQVCCAWAALARVGGAHEQRAYAAVAGQLLLEPEECAAMVRCDVANTNHTDT